MNIVAVVPNYPPESRVGSWLTTHQWLRHLAARGHSVRVLLVGVIRGDYHIDGVDVRCIAVEGRTRPEGPVPNWPIVHEHGEWADVIVSHCGDDGYGQGIANRSRRPSVRLAHSDAAHLTHGAHLTIAVSQAVADTVTAGPTVVVPPPVDPADYATTRGDRVTLVNLAKFKGGSLFWSLVEALPGTEFLGVLGGWGHQVLPGDELARNAAHYLGEYQATDNAVVVPTCEDMRSVYRRTRVLLMPSKSESFGRVALEAACSGIPTIAHPSPGLVEALGDAGVWCDRRDPQAWVDAIRRLDAPDAYEKASQAALERAAALDPQGSVDAFEKALTSVLAVAA